ncbi:hypothetical protein ACTR42_000230 [Citrobacter freundii]|uniref:hypothetical protein n=1 Tax=Citrobacter freundii TaxID=546 RepID=UPI00397BA3D4
MLEKKCQCEGRNPQCAYCGGWGYLDSIGESRGSSGQGQLAPAKKKKNRNKQPLGKNTAAKRHKAVIELKCILCGCVVEDFASHNCIHPK